MSYATLLLRKQYTLLQKQTDQIVVAANAIPCHEIGSLWMGTPLATARTIFSNNLKRLVEEKHKGNASALSRALGVNPSLVSRWLRGKAFPETDEQLDRIAKALGVTASELFADPEVSMDLRTAWRIVREAMSKQIGDG